MLNFKFVKICNSQLNWIDFRDNFDFNFIVFKKKLNLNEIKVFLNNELKKSARDFLLLK